MRRRWNINHIPASSSIECSESSRSKSRTYFPVQVCSAFRATSSSYGVTIGLKKSWRIPEKIKIRLWQKFKKNPWAHLRINETVLWTCHKDETFDFHKVGEFRWVYLAHTDGIAFFMSTSNDGTYMSYCWQVGCYSCDEDVEKRKKERESERTNAQRAYQNPKDVRVSSFLNEDVAAHE